MGFPGLAGKVIIYRESKEKRKKTAETRECRKEKGLH